MQKNKFDLDILFRWIKTDQAFRFVRFSDGETEILKGRLLEINETGVNFRGKKLSYRYPKFDEKSFDPARDIALIKDLSSSLSHHSEFYIRGIPGSHNGKEEKEFYRSFIGNDSNLTLCDLLHNDNYRFFVREFMPFVLKKQNVYCVANEHASDLGYFSKIFRMPTNAFPQYSDVISSLLDDVLSVPPGSIIISSASSFSNILGWKLDVERPDVTFIDVGSGVNYLIGLDKVTRVYQIGVFGPRSFRDVKMFAKHMINKKRKMQW